MISTKPPTTGPVAGVDTHADTHTLALVTAQGAVEFIEQFTADQRGYIALLHRLQEVEGLATVGVEGTNSYGAEGAAGHVYVTYVNTETHDHLTLGVNTTMGTDQDHLVDTAR